MLQLPHMDMDVIKRLGRRRVRGLGELLELAHEERIAALQGAGMHHRPRLPPDSYGYSIQLCNTSSRH